MLSSRDTPFNEDGYALILEDIKRLNLLIAGGSNDLNAGAIDADQQALNDLSSALDAHEIDLSAHSTLLANYLLRSDYTAGYVPDYVITNSGSGTNQAVVGTTQLTTCIPDATGTGGMALASGVFTAPGSGLYHAIGSLGISYTTSSAGQANYLLEIFASTGVAVFDEGSMSLTVNGNKINSACLSGHFYLTVGQTLKFYAQHGYTGTLSLGPNVYVSQISVTRLTTT